jgi:DNA polymerase-3 subunit epsilon
MNSKNKFLWFAASSVGFIIVLLVAIFIMFWQPLPLEDKQFLIRLFKANFGYIFSAGFFMFAVLGLFLDWFFRFYVIPVGRLAEEMELTYSVNPGHRVRIDGGRDMIRLCHIINQSAQNFEELQNSIQQKIARAKTEVEVEKNILAGFMAQMPEGILICNARGDILLYNQQARRFLEEKFLSDAGESSTHMLGLGRSVYEVVDRHLIEHAVGEIHLNLENQKENAAVYFVFVSGDQRLLRVEAVPILDHQRIFAGYILIFQDITRQVQSERQMNVSLQSLNDRLRASVSGIRLAVELILEYPRLDADQLKSFLEIIHKESILLTEIVNTQKFNYSPQIRGKWPRVPVSVSVLMESMSAKALSVLNIAIDMEQSDAESPLKVDHYSMVFAGLFVLRLLKLETGFDRFSCRIKELKGYMNIDFVWPGGPVKLESLRKWKEMTLEVGGGIIPLTLGEVLEHHEGEIISSSRSDRNLGYLRFILPVMDAAAVERIRPMVVLESRPEFYDFDLFHQPGQTPELDSGFLSDMNYTVFDTETTGLDPAADEIISIGAVRIVNGRLLRSEIFDQLIDPRRLVPYDSVKVHGIQPERLQGKPVIEEILPRFHRFSENTILVAHNAAFDMRMLQLKEAKTGVKFINPVLDTLLLSAVVHPVHEKHNIEDIARRLGVNVVGRHTALGDALTTAEIFLKLIKILAAKGIHTMKEARELSQKTYYARLRY